MYEYNAKLSKVIDGDTIDADIDLGFQTFVKQRIKLYGVDTPQSRSKVATEKEEGIKAWHIEGYESLNWVLLDFVNIVVHVFSRESRDYYDIERLWADGSITDIQDKK